MPSESPQIKVLHLRSSPFLGSPEKLILGRLKVMDRNECHYLLGIFDEQHGEENDFSKSVAKLNFPSFLLHDSMFLFLSNLIKIYKIATNKHINIICTHDYKSNLHGLLVGKLLKIPIISILHGRTGADLKVRLYEILDDFVLRFFDALICVSKKASGERVRSTQNNGCRIFLIPNAVDIQEIDNLSKAPDNELDILKKKNEKLVVYAGRLSKEKGLCYLIEAAKNVLSKRKDVKFVILGEGSEKEKLEKMILDNQLSESIHLLGFKKNVCPFYQEMDFLVLPSLTEGMPVVILEAFALCKPVVATNVGGIPEIVQHNVSGMLVSSKNITELSDAMEFLLSHPEVALKMGSRGFECVHANHNFEIQAKHYFSAYRETLSNITP